MVKRLKRSSTSNNVTFHVNNIELPSARSKQSTNDWSHYGMHRQDHSTASICWRHGPRRFQSTEKWFTPVISPYTTSQPQASKPYWIKYIAVLKINTQACYPSEYWHIRSQHNFTLIKTIQHATITVEVKVRSNDTNGRNLLTNHLSGCNWREMESLGSVNQ